MDEYTKRVEEAFCPIARRVPAFQWVVRGRAGAVLVHARIGLNPSTGDRTYMTLSFVVTHDELNDRPFAEALAMLVACRWADAQASARELARTYRQCLVPLESM